METVSSMQQFGDLFKNDGSLPNIMKIKWYKVSDSRNLLKLSAAFLIATYQKILYAL